MCYDLVLALSVDLEDPEVTRIRKEHDMYKLQLDNEMSSMQRRVLKFEEDNKRLKAALQVSMPTVFSYNFQLYRCYRMIFFRQSEMQGNV